MNDSLILTLCLRENTLLISNAIIEQLGSPSLIQIKMNEADKSLLINPCEYGTRGAVVVPDNHQYQLEMPGRSLIRRIQRITEWPDDNPRVLCGVFIPQHNAIYFSLDAAQYAILQPVPGTDDSTFQPAPDRQADAATDDSTLQPVPGRQADAATDDSTLPTREGLEAVAPSQMDAITEVRFENDIGADVPVGCEDGDLNG